MPSVLACRARARARAFTLVELIVVILVLGGLATVGVVGYTQVTERGEAAAAQTNLRQIATAVVAHHTADQLPAMTRSSFLDALEEVSVDVTDGLAADGWTFYGAGAAPDAAGEYAVGFDTGQGTPAGDIGGTRAVVVTATSTGQAFARIIFWPMGTTTAPGVSDPQIGDGAGQVPPGTTPGDVLSDPTLITPPGGAGPGNGGGDPGGGQPSVCPAGLSFAAEVDYTFDQPHYGIWLHTQIPDAGFDWSRITVTQAHTPAGSTAEPTVTPVTAAPYGWVSWVMWAPPAGAGPDDVHMFTLAVDGTACVTIGGDLPEVAAWPGGWTGTSSWLYQWRHTSGVLDPGGTAHIAVLTPLTYGSSGQVLRSDLISDTGTNRGSGWSTTPTIWLEVWCRNAAGSVQRNSYYQANVPKTAGTISLSNHTTCNTGTFDHLRISEDSGTVELGLWYPTGHPEAWRAWVQD